MERGQRGGRHAAIQQRLSLSKVVCKAVGKSQPQEFQMTTGSQAEIGMSCRCESDPTFHL